MRLGTELHTRFDIIKVSQLVTKIQRTGVAMSYDRVERLCNVAVAEGKFEMAGYGLTHSFRVIDKAIQKINEGHELAKELAVRLGGRAVNATVVFDLEEANALAARLKV